MTATTDDQAQADSMLLLLQRMLPAAETARLEAIADGDQALLAIGVAIGIASQLEDVLTMAPINASQLIVPDEHGVDQESCLVARSYWQWLLDRVPTMH